MKRLCMKTHLATVNIKSRIVHGPETPRQHSKINVQMSPKTTRGPPQPMGKSPRPRTYRPSRDLDEALPTRQPTRSKIQSLA